MYASWDAMYASAAGPMRVLGPCRDFLGGIPARWGPLGLPAREIKGKGAEGLSHLPLVCEWSALVQNQIIHQKESGRVHWRDGTPVAGAAVLLCGCGCAQCHDIPSKLSGGVHAVWASVQSVLVDATRNVYLVLDGLGFKYLGFPPMYHSVLGFLL